MFNLEIMYHLRGANQASGGLCAWDSNWSPIPHLEACHLPSLREFHHAAHYTQHTSADVQGINLIVNLCHI